MAKGAISSTCAHPAPSTVHPVDHCRLKRKVFPTAPRSERFSPELTENSKTLLLTAQIGAWGDQTDQGAKSRDQTAAKHKHLTRSNPATVNFELRLLGQGPPWHSSTQD